MGYYWSVVPVYRYLNLISIIMVLARVPRGEQIQGDKLINIHVWFTEVINESSSQDMTKYRAPTQLETYFQLGIN